MNKFILLACVLGVVLCLPPKWNSLEGYTFEQYVQDFHKDYVQGSADFDARKTIFEKNLADIIAFNKDASHSYKKGVNRNTDQTVTEFKESNLGYSKNMNNVKAFRNLATKSVEYTAESVSALPVNVDWRDKNVVTPVKDQGHCGSCWAFASVATIESYAAINSG